MNVFHHSFFAMGTRLNMVIPELDSDEGYDIAEALENLVLGIEKKLSRFDGNSLISEINARASIVPVALDDECRRIFSTCMEYHERTSGAFDITLLPLTRLWHEAAKAENGMEPDAHLIENAIAQTGMSSVLLEQESRTLRFDKPGMQVDLGGFGKGYALGEVIPMLREFGISRAFLSFGESSISVLGNRSDSGRNWEIGIEHIFRQGESIHTLQLKDASLSTSGTTSFNFPKGKARSAHVISPFTGYPVEGCRTMSVVSESPVEAEILSTALLVLASDKRAGILNNWFTGQAIEFTFDELLNSERSWTYGIAEYQTNQCL